MVRSERLGRRLEDQREGGPPVVGDKGVVMGHPVVDHPQAGFSAAQPGKGGVDAGLVGKDVLARSHRHNGDRRRVLPSVVIDRQDLDRGFVARLAREGEIKAEPVGHGAGRRPAQYQYHHPKDKDEPSVGQDGEGHSAEDRGLAGRRRRRWVPTLQCGQGHRRLLRLRIIRQRMILPRRIAVYNRFLCLTSARRRVDLLPGAPSPSGRSATRSASCCPRRAPLPPAGLRPRWKRSPSNLVILR